jgi:hypothetical protein
MLICLLCREFSSKELRTVGNYSLGRLIGKGSFGKVYLATHKLTNGSKVRGGWRGTVGGFGLANRAWQVVLKSANKDDSNLAREIHHHRQFLHPHIARLYEVIVTENLVWLVLEYCPGRIDKCCVGSMHLILLRRRIIQLSLEKWLITGGEGSENIYAIGRGGVICSQLFMRPPRFKTGEHPP